MENDDNIVDQDPWLARDKLYHFLFCFTLAVFFSVIASCSRYSFLRTHSIRIGSILSLLAGAAKEAADHIGLFPSAGASFRDGVADVIGVLIASLALYLWRRYSDRPGSDSGRTRRVLPV
ncbi:Transmembrane protein [Melia azedarach]|uniref:Transmembrane protein n=1 Tax=Melia azedarach TaxID=155640 RepID=A0ACC1Y4I3_MELAZ|nr:Transmembrane protein [Melia azedarach]